MKKFLLFILLLIPIDIMAYSNKLIVGGETIGIEIHSNGVYVVDFYSIDNHYIGKENGFLKGDLITEIDNNPIHNISDVNNYLSNNNEHSILVNRNGKDVKLKLKSIKKQDKYESGLYLKDTIQGVGTLSYIDPDTHVFASLGHEIVEKNSNYRFPINKGYIYDAKVNYINKSSNGDIGEVHAEIFNSIKGVLEKNELNGIYGKYIGDIDTTKLYEISDFNDIKLGDASILFKLNDMTDAYSINIIDIKEDEIKNIYFEITDDRLINEAGGIVQGMSGSPIIQNNKIIGVVNYVVVNDSKKGYGIYIKKMLEEGDTLLQE